MSSPTTIPTPVGSRNHGPRPVDRDDPLPLWAQLEADLRRRLAAHEFDDRFPTDHELVDQYDVSRHTVRDAVGRLCDDGLLERRRGIGTVVRRAEFEQPLGALYSLFRSIETQGVEQRSRVSALEVTRDGEAADRLGLDPGAELVHLRRIRLAGDEPLALDESWLPAELARPLLEADFTHTALYRELADRCDVHAVAGWERIRPAVVSGADAVELGVAEGSAAFAVERLARDGSGRPVDWRLSLVRGDRYGFAVRWGADDSDTTTSLQALPERV